MTVPGGGRIGRTQGAPPGGPVSPMTESAQDPPHHLGVRGSGVPAPHHPPGLGVDGVLLLLTPAVRRTADSTG